MDAPGAKDTEGADHLRSLLDSNPTVEFIRLQWIDFTATVRCRLVTVRQAIKLAQQDQGVKVASQIISGLLMDGSFNEVPPGTAARLLPDWSTLTVCHYQPGHAAVICDVEEQDSGFECCPRSLLRDTEQSTKTTNGVTFLVGIEIEFYLTESAESTTPIKDVMPYCATASLRSPQLSVLEDAVRWIEQAGIPLWTIHSELVAGLYEISTEPMTPLRAADAMVYIHEAIKTAASNYGLHATMHPKPFDKTHGVGQHIHISLSTKQKEESFLAGVLHSVPAISAISMPNYDSWLRRDFMGGSWIGWDVENRKATIRKIEDAYWEFRFVDGTANNYLTLATILRTGMLGWEEGRELKAKPMSQWPENLNQKSKVDVGVEHAAPLNLKDALQSFEGNENVKKALGEKLMERFLKYKRKEEAMMAEKTLQERRLIGMSVF